MASMFSRDESAKQSNDCIARMDQSNIKCNSSNGPKRSQIASQWYSFVLVDDRGHLENQ